MRLGRSPRPRCSEAFRRLPAILIGRVDSAVEAFHVADLDHHAGPVARVDDVVDLGDRIAERLLRRRHAGHDRAPPARARGAADRADR